MEESLLCLYLGELCRTKIMFSYPTGTPFSKDTFLVCPCSIPYRSKVNWIHIYVLSTDVPMGILILMEELQNIHLKRKLKAEEK